MKRLSMSSTLNMLVLMSMAGDIMKWWNTKGIYEQNSGSGSFQLPEGNAWFYEHCNEYDNI